MELDLDYIKDLVKKTLIERLAVEFGMRYAQVGVSNRHIHLSKQHLNVLFGTDYSLTPLRALSQPKQFVCTEKLTLIGNKSKFDNVRVLGPTRDKTQVEISVSDCFYLGINPCVRMSGDLKNSPGAILVGPKGKVELNEGVIVSARHIHVSKEESLIFGLKDMDKVKIKKSGERGIVFEDVLVRAGEAHKLEIHLDTDEANAANIKNGEWLNIYRGTDYGVD